MQYNRLADILSDLEGEMIQNQKAVFLTYPNMPTSNIQDFRLKAYSSQTLLEKANVQAANKAYNLASDYLSITIEKGYNSGIKNIRNNTDKKINESPNEQIARLKENSQQTLNRILNIAVSSSIAIFTSILGSIQSYDNADNIYQAVDMAQSQYLDKGIVGNVTSNGARVNLTTFADMVEGEYEHSAILTGEGHARDELDEHLVLVSSHPGCCEKCAKWENKVLIDDAFSGGKPDGQHELLTVAMSQGLLHPNCRHRFKYVTKDEAETAQSKLKPDWTEKQNREQYAAAQRQRQIERNIRSYKRLEQGSLSESERLKAHQKVVEWQAKQREHIKASNKLDGVKLYRSYERERVDGKTNPTLAAQLQDKANFSDDINYLKLPYEQKAAVNRYISSDSYRINEKLRNKSNLTEDEKTFVGDMRNALNNLKKVKDVTLTRDLNFKDDEDYENFVSHHKVNEAVSYDEFISTTTKSSYQDNPQVRIIIHHANKGVDMTRINKNESEVLYPPDSSFMVLTKKYENGMLVIELEEL